MGNMKTIAILLFEHKISLFIIVTSNVLWGWINIISLMNVFSFNVCAVTHILLNNIIIEMKVCVFKKIINNKTMTFS